jgi:hypothetical protein
MFTGTNHALDYLLLLIYYYGIFILPNFDGQEAKTLMFWEELASVAVPRDRMLCEFQYTPLVRGPIHYGTPLITRPCSCISDIKLKNLKKTSPLSSSNLDYIH